ncbi:MAG: glutathione S-transferase family protein [Polyangiaceae bacterium]
MGLLVDGEWKDVWYDTASTGGSFVRKDASFREVVSRERGARFTAEPDRYHLYVSLACPWAHRTLIVRALKGLEEILPISVVNPFMAEDGWTFADAPGVIPDPIFNAKFLYEIYQRARPAYTGRVTVPVLWDKREGTIVNNESSEIIRMLDDAFDPLATRKLASLYPAPLRAEIDAVNARVYDTVNNGVYKAGFATAQAPYEEAVRALFDTLDTLEKKLESQRYVVGDALTEADVRLFTTLVRFDAVYFGHFKCNLRRIADYPRLWAYARSIYQLPFVAPTVSFDHIKEHYYRSHASINPTRIVPLGPVQDWTVRGH